MLNAPAEALPLVGLPAVLLWNMAEAGVPAAACVDSCITLRYALAEYGVASKIEAVGVGISAAGTKPTLYGPDGGMRPHYNADGTFNGHTILLIPAAGRFLDPTVQQFPAIPRTVQASVPLIARLPVPGGLGTAPFPVDRTDHFVVYVPLPAPYRDAWRASPVLEQRDREFREVGANLAANVFDLMRSELCRDRTAQSPYPRIRVLLTALDGMATVVDGGEYRFAEPGTGRKIRLADIP